MKVKVTMKRAVYHTFEVEVPAGTPEEVLEAAHVGQPLMKTENTENEI